jgi:hypothetical protein
MWAERRAPSAPAWLLILTLHVAVLTLWNTRPTPSDPTRVWSEIRLIPARPAHSPPPASPLAPALPPVPHAVTPPELPATIAPETDLLSSPNLSSSPDIADTPRDAPLRLTLPSAAASAARQPALDDPRANTPISRFGARIAHDLGDDGRWVEERMDADFVRLRRGNTCVNLHRGRGAALQPFNESAAPTLWGATPAYRCERR